MATLHFPASPEGVFPNHMCQQPPTLLFHSSHGLSLSTLRILVSLIHFYRKECFVALTFVGRKNDIEPTESGQSGSYEPGH